jgi:hypothetical protein
MSYNDHSDILALVQNWIEKKQTWMEGIWWRQPVILSWARCLQRLLYMMHEGSEAKRSGKARVNENRWQSVRVSGGRRTLRQVATLATDKIGPARDQPALKSYSQEEAAMTVGGGLLTL